MKCRAQQQGFCLLQENQITEVEINMLSVGPISRPREISYLRFFFTFNFLLLSLTWKLTFGWEGWARQSVRAGGAAGTGQQCGGHCDAHSFIKCWKLSDSSPWNQQQHLYFHLFLFFFSSWYPQHGVGGIDVQKLCCLSFLLLFPRSVQEHLDMLGKRFLRVCFALLFLSLSTLMRSHCVSNTHHSVSQDAQCCV